jgi:hypothetical protein
MSSATKPNTPVEVHSTSRHPALLTMPAVLEHLRAHRAGAEIPAEYLVNLGQLDRQRAVSGIGLSQRLVATMAGVDVRTYGSFERKGLASDAVVHTVVEILGASRAQQVAIWRWVGRPVPHGLCAPLRVDPGLADQLTGSTRSPAVWLTPEWDVLAANQPAAALGPLARPGANWAEEILGPHGRAREMLVDWTACARWMIETLRMATVDPGHSPRTTEVALVVRQHQPTADLWDSRADMREDPDGMTLQMQLPDLSPDPVTLKLSTLTRGDLRLLVLQPVREHGG